MAVIADIRRTGPSMTMTQHSPPAPVESPRTHTRVHVQVLLVCAAVIIASAILDLSVGGVTLPGTGGRSMPGICLTRVALHVNCPGCGVTRSFVAMAHGELRSAFSFHRLGPPLFVYVLFQIALRAYALLAGSLPRWASRPRFGPAFWWLLIVALWVNWVYNLITGAAFDT